MTAATSTKPRHHPSWREVRDTFLAELELRQAYQDLAPRFSVVRQLITLREQRGWSQCELADRAGMKQDRLEPAYPTASIASNHNPVNG
jgi:ribosome-binding protein aMBF1 (putative translation factor)